MRTACAAHSASACCCIERYPPPPPRHRQRCESKCARYRQATCRAQGQSRGHVTTISEQASRMAAVSPRPRACTGLAHVHVHVHA